MQPFPQPNDIEANISDRSLSTSEGETIEKGKPDALSNLSYYGNASVLVTGTIQSKNYQPGLSGWCLRSDGTAEFNQ